MLKTLSIILITTAISSVGTFFYTTKKMAPSFYQEVVAKARSYVKNIPKLRAPASDCSGGSGGLLGGGQEGKPQLKEMLQQINKSRKEKKEFLKQFED